MTRREGGKPLPGGVDRPGMSSPLKSITSNLCRAGPSTHPLHNSRGSYNFNT